VNEFENAVRGVAAADDPQADDAHSRGDSSSPSEHRGTAVGKHAASYWSQPAKRARSWLEALFNRGAVSLVALITGIVCVYLVSDIARSCRQRAALRSVTAKMRRLNEFFLGMHSDASICLCCVEFVPKSSPKKVTFLCGHSFHTSCVNAWYKRHACDIEDRSALAGHCPVCAGRCGDNKEAPPADPIDDGASDSDEEDLLDEATSDSRVEPSENPSHHDHRFALRSLSERYPTIISQELAEHFAKLPSAVLMSDFEFSKLGHQGRLPCLEISTVFGRV
jgi:hypothetical protein